VKNIIAKIHKYEQRVCVPAETVSHM